MIDPWLLLKSISAGIAVAAPVGPMSLLCMQRTLGGGRAPGLAFGAGIAAKLAPNVLAWINRLSGLVLIGFAFYALSAVNLRALP
ncbi:MAG: hypothetical protein Q7R45_01280 [Sulfuricaulis sp.]|nr:hypothetical protein [Sulfuricaulis sp.]